MADVPRQPGSLQTGFIRLPFMGGRSIEHDTFCFLNNEMVHPYLTLYYSQPTTTLYYSTWPELYLPRLDWNPYQTIHSADTLELHSKNMASTRNGFFLFIMTGICRYVYG